MLEVAIQFILTQEPPACMLHIVSMFTSNCFVYYLKPIENRSEWRCVHMIQESLSLLFNGLSVLAQYVCTSSSYCICCNAFQCLLQFPKFQMFQNNGILREHIS